MSTQTQTQLRGAGRNRRSNRGRGGNRGSARTNVQSASVNGPDATKAEEGNAQEARPENAPAAETTDEQDDGDICWICAEPVKYWSVPECNHRTCHVCALRLRALYKKLECTFCKEPQQSVIFTTSADAAWSSYTPDAIPHKDPKLSIFFETQEMMVETLILLRFNCPDAKCEYIGTGWNDLKLHVRGVHGKVMCDLCIRHKKVFAHEQAFYSPGLLPYHLPSIPLRLRRGPPKEPIEGGVHPLCEFCQECFFSSDELYAHMRERHEECFICKRNEVRDQYFLNYDALEKHFMTAHHPCQHPNCLAQKFVVFGSPLDLKGHMVSEHGSDMSSKDLKEAMRIQAEFEFEQVGAAPGRRGRSDREPPPREPPPPQPGPSRVGNRRRENFGAHLTEGGSGPNGPSVNHTPQPSRRPSPSPPRGDVDPETAERHAAFIARVRAVAPNSANAAHAIRAAVRSYRASESRARDLISTIWNVVDNDLDNTASLVNALVDLLDEEEKKSDLLSAWNGFKVEQRRNFPDLVPTTQGSEYAGIASGRVLNAKHSTATHSSSRSSRQVWDRVAQAASSSNSSRPGSSATARPGSSGARPGGDQFPHLVTSVPTPAPVPAYRQPPRHTPWTGTSAAASVPIAQPIMPQSVPGRGKGKSNAPPITSKAAFPELPSSNAGRTKAPVSGNPSLRRLMGNSTPQGSVWSGGNGANPTSPAGEVSGGPTQVTGENDQPEGGGATSSGGKKKGKGKQKQTLFTFGTFPT